MTRSLSILHLASFCGNSGDVLNHLGFRPWFESIISRVIRWHELEIRGHYRHEWLFDDSFIELVNRHDILVIGGGNYLETWPRTSRSGTSIDLLVEDFARINIPIFINSIGVDISQGISDNAALELPRLFRYLVNSPKVLVSVRNDGTIESLSQLAGKEITDSTVDLPDAGFFVPKPAVMETNLVFIGINLACDMPELRFRDGDPELFLNQIGEFITRMCQFDDRIRFKFFQHIFSDLSVQARLLELLPDKVRRERAYVVGLHPDEEGALLIVREYATCAVVVANRFHSAVVPIGMGIPTIGISNYPQIARLFEDLSLSDRCINGHDTERLADNLYKAIVSVFHSPNIHQKCQDVVHMLKSRRQQASEVLRNWLMSVSESN